LKIFFKTANSLLILDGEITFLTDAALAFPAFGYTPRLKPNSLLRFVTNFSISADVILFTFTLPKA
jgi:hypothetical protein